MAQFLGTYDRCAQTVLATVISRPTPGRVVLDAGTKSLNEGVQKGGIDLPPLFVPELAAGSSG